MQEGKNLERMNVILDQLESAGKGSLNHSSFWKAAVLIRRAKLFRLKNGDTGKTVGMFSLNYS